GAWKNDMVLALVAGEKSEDAGARAWEAHFKRDAGADSAWLRRVGETLNDPAHVYLSLHVDVPGNSHTDAMVTSAT
ncbi:Hypothetical predicted protein, partial [Marmota monax]